MTMYNLYRRHTRLRQRNAVASKTAQLDPEAAIIRNDESQISYLRKIDPWVINLGDDPLSNGES